MSADEQQTVTPPAAPYRASIDFTQDDRRDYARLVGMLKREWGVEETGDVVLRALREAAQRT